jgi:murein tripeptide amidase MpaA
MDFDYGHYYKYDELIEFLDRLVDCYPSLIELQPIGKSYEGRLLCVATLTNQDTGTALEKPAYWIDGNTHAAEVTGSAVCLYTIAYLLSHYGNDAAVTRLLDSYTLYVMPRIAVDGAEWYLTTPYSLRSSTRRYPQSNHQDGLYPKDINGDGLILQMRIRNAAGAWKVSGVDSRIMLRREPDEFDGVFYSLLPEGLIHNYDGFNIAIAPVQTGIDFNRNYPNRWESESMQKGAGEFPLSEPETRAEVEFWQTHRNINGFYTYHTYGGVLLRPYNTYPDEQFPIEDLEVYKFIGAKAEQITGYPCISVYHEFADRPRDMLYGVMDDYGYEQRGWFGFTPELWDAAKAAGLQRKMGVDAYRSDPWFVEDNSLKLMTWNDEALGGRGFIEWQSFQHPQLGEVEIGGWDVKRVWENAPPEYLQEICEKQCQFTIAHALMSPRLHISRTVVSCIGEGVYHIVVQLENQGFLPTYTSKKAVQRQAVQPISITLNLPKHVSLIMGSQNQEVGHLEGRANKLSRDSGAFDFRCTAEWVIKAPPESLVEVTAIAERAGTTKATLLLQ